MQDISYKDKKITINEIYYSIQGESTHSGEKCIFVRTTSCNLRCTWCDSTFSFYEGKSQTIQNIINEIKKYPLCKLVLITGGEPLIQKNIYDLMTVLIQNGYKVLLETSGSILINQVPEPVHIVLDIKAPSSQEDHKNRFENLRLLKSSDEIKVVIQDKSDFEWLEHTIIKYQLQNRIITTQASFEKITLKELAEYIKESAYSIKMNIQLHKYIYDATQRKT